MSNMSDSGQPFRILTVAPASQPVPGEVFRQIGGENVGRLNHWNDLLGIGPELRIDAVLWFNPPADERDWLGAVTQLSRLRPTTGVVLVPQDRATVGPMESTIIDRRQRGQIRNVTAAPSDIAGLVNGLRRVLADQGKPVADLKPKPDFRSLRPSPWVGHSKPADLFGLRESLSPVPHQSGPARIITVLGPKGGVGKTTVSVGLACLAAKEAPHRVVLIDLDGQSADVAVHLDLLDAPDIVDLMPHLEDGPGRLPLYGERLYVVPGPARPDLGSLVTPEAVERILDSLSSSFPIIIVDTGARLSDEAAWRAVEKADHLVFVLTPDAGSLRIARLLMDHADRFGWQDKGLTTVLNQVYDRLPLEADRIARFLGVPIQHRIPLDRSAVDAAVLAGKPLVLNKPDHPISQALRTLSIELGLVSNALPPVTAAASIRRRIRALLGKGADDGRSDWPLTRGATR